MERAGIILTHFIRSHEDRAKVHQAGSLAWWKIEREDAMHATLKLDINSEDSATGLAA